MDKSDSLITAIQSEGTLFGQIANTYVELAKLFGKSTPDWLPSWFESFLLPSGKYDVHLDRTKPSRAQRLVMLKLDKDSNLQSLNNARSLFDEPSIKKLSLKVKQIEAEISKVIRTNGEAKPGPNKGHITSKDLMAARLVEVYLLVNGREPSARNRKLTIALVSLLETLGVLRVPSGNRLNGARKAFEMALSVSEKVNDVELRKNDVLHDEIVLARIRTRNSLQQCAMLGRASWIFPGMNGPVYVYTPEN